MLESYALADVVQLGRFTVGEERQDRLAELFRLLGLGLIQQGGS